MFKQIMVLKNHKNPPPPYPIAYGMIVHNFVGLLNFVRAQKRL